MGRAAGLLLIAAAVAAWIVLPTAPGYDTATHLVWAREILAGRAPDTTALAAPTMHPLWLLLSLPAEPTGAGASLLQLLDLLSLGLVIACVWRLAADVAGFVAGAVAALAVGSSFALLLLAFKAYVDLPFLALALLAVVLERDWRPASGAEPLISQSGVGEISGSAPLSVDAAAAEVRAAASDLLVPGLFLVAGLLRPEAWGLGLLFLALRWWRGARLVSLVPAAALVLAAPIIWALTDLVLSGDPLYSLTGTQQLAEALGRKTGLGNAPIELVKQLGDLTRPPVAAAGLLGAALAVWRIGWRPLVVPLAPLVAGVIGFLLVGALGLPLLQRYLLVPAALLGVFAGIAAAAILATALGRPLPGALGAGRVAANDGDAGDMAPAAGGSVAAGAPSTALRLAGVLLLVVANVGVGGYLALKASSFRVLADGVLREAQWQREGTALLEQPALRAARRCGPVTLPTYRFVSEMLLATGLRPGEIVSRATELGGAGPQEGGVALTITGSKAARTRLGEAAGVPHTTNAVPPGYAFVARSGPFYATTRCP
ncbi:MAG: hypothetical protein J7513_07390 [Solirubrobacteraceae bacterium]|nr:hypothetical protein [Solirubrobacteraceae bacterium]